MSNSRSIVSESIAVSLSFLAAVLLSPPIARGAGGQIIDDQPGLWVLPQLPHARAGQKPDLDTLPTISKDEMDAQADAIGRIPNVRVSYWPNQVPRDINGIIGTYPRDANESDLAELMSFLRPMFLATGSESLEYRSSDEDPERDTRFVRLGQRIKGLPVREASLTLEIEASTGQIRNVGGQFLPDRGLPKKPEITQDQVIPILIETIRSAGYKPSDFAVLDEPELMYTMDLDLRGWLAWVVSIHYSIDGAGVLQRVFMNAVDGTILRTDPLAVEALSRQVYDLGGGTLVPGTPLQMPFTDPDAQAAYDNVAAPYNYLKNRFNRDSYDGAGKQIRLNVHYGMNVNNAYFFPVGGYANLAFGSGPILKDTARDPDIVAHEYGHAVTYYSTPGGVGLAGVGEPGSIDEALSDILPYRRMSRFTA